MYIHFLLVLCSVTFVSCHTNRSYSKSSVNINNIFLIDSRCKRQVTDTQDSTSGTVRCGDKFIHYQYGKYCDQVPTTQEEEFKNAFRGNYHAKFFEKIHIDSKLYMFFMDSVQVDKIMEIQQPDNSLLFSCTTCNKVVRLSFRKRIYFYPFYSDFKEDKNYTITTDTIDGFYRKMYLSNSDTLPSGLQLSPIFKSTNRKTLCLTSESKTGDTELMNLFKSVRMIR